MACELTRSRGLDCKDIMGGVKNIYFAQHEDLTITHTDGSVSQIAGAGGYSAGYYRYKIPKGQASMVETINASTENGTVFYEGAINLKLHKLTLNDRNEIKLLAQNRLIVFVELYQQTGGKNDVWAFGVENGCELTAGTSNSGAAFGDLNGYDLTFTSMESFPCLRLGAYTSVPFDQFTLTTIAS
tara:strand:- start:883 stop:1437 length:555 start_codon:yes stop_codon:yes gene_type:complete